MPFQLPDPIRKARLVNVQKWLLEHKEEKSVEALSKAVSLMLEETVFRQHIAANPTLAAKVQNEADLMKLAWAFWYHLMMRRDNVAAAMMLWDGETFTAEPQCVQLIWNAVMSKRMVCIMGGGGMGKSMSTTALYMLEWIFDPEWTRIQLASASESHLLGNIFADAVRLHSGASMVLPGKQDTESISLDKKTAQGIFTLTLPGGVTGKSKIKGAHTKSRGAHPRQHHPLFGKRSRIFALVDECQEVPSNVFDEIPNRFSSMEEHDVDHIKFVICANPRDIFSRFAKCAEPVGGWSKITRDDVTWVSKAGWAVISLDQTKHENFIARKKVFAGFATYDGFQSILKTCDGDPEHPRMYTLCYGKFPPQGTLFACIKQKHLLASQREWIFSGPTTAVAGCDPAYSADRPTLPLGRAGIASGWRDAEGKEYALEKPRMAVQIDLVVILSHGDAQEVADEAMFRLKEMGVLPQNFAIDQTGSGRGVADIIRHQWREKVGTGNIQEGEKAPIIGVEYASTPSRMKIAEEDQKLPCDLYDRTATELWYAGAKLWEYDVMSVGQGVDLEVLSELASRMGDMQPGLGRKLTIETKLAFKQRTGSRSPDLADGVLLLIHAARTSIPGLTPKAPGTQLPPPKRDPFNWNKVVRPDENQAIPACDFGVWGETTLSGTDLLKD